MGYSMYLLGASEETSQKAFVVIHQRYSGIRLLGRNNGYFKDNAMIFEAFKSSRPQIVLVAMGSPKQELFAAAAVREIPGIVFIGCGGALDVIAGTAKRAPEFFINNHLEWLYRLIRQPWRWKRQMILPVYVSRLLRHAFKKRALSRPV
jgi:N-acetylglucosaminyldiphosphoundecaprenol N-acetyl-beta-D-mannosaminyltransferase